MATYYTHGNISALYLNLALVSANGNRLCLIIPAATEALESTFCDQTQILNSTFIKCRAAHNMNVEFLLWQIVTEAIISGLTL